MANSVVGPHSSIEQLRGGVNRIDAFLPTIDPRHPDRAAILTDKCMVLLFIFIKSEDPNDIVEAVKAGREAVHALLPNDANKGPTFANLSTALADHFRYSNRIEDIEEAIEYGKLAIVSLTRGSSGWKKSNANLYRLVYQKGAHNRTTQTLDDAIGFLEQAGEPELMLSPEDSIRLHCLSTLLAQRYEASGSLQHLERSIQAGYQSIEKLGEGTARQDAYDCTAAALTAHFQATGQLNSLEEALRLSNDLLSDMNDSRYSSAKRASRFCNHGQILEAMSRRLSETDPGLSTEALVKAITSGQAALSILRSDAENRPVMVSMISAWMGTMAKMSQDSRHAEEGIALLNEALEMNNGHSIDRETLLANLSRLWEIKYTIHRGAKVRGQCIDILDTAIEIGKQALAFTRDDDKNIGERRKNLASMMFTRSLDLEDESTYPSILELFTKAAETETASLPIRIPSALQAGIFHEAAGDMEEARRSFQYGIGLLTSGNIQAASAEDLQQILRAIPGLGSLAASMSLATGRPPFDALSSMESANCVTAGLAMNSKSDTSELAEQHPDIAKAYDDIRSRLAVATRQLKDGFDYQNFSALQRSLIAEVAGKENEIRQLDGFEQFQLPLDAEQVMRLAKDGPIVSINVSMFRSDAVIVTEDGIQSLHLPEMTHEALQQRVSVFNRLGNTARRNAVALEDEDSSTSTEITTENALRWLWDVAVRPILDATPLTPSRRLWWITSGSAGRAPFHVAGNYAGGPEENAINRVKSSYISSFKALKYGRDRRRATIARQGMLLVTMPTNPYPHHPLNTEFEEKAIQAAFEESKLLHLTRPDPETVLEKISNFSFVHFACHGASIDSDPNKSGLLLVKNGRSAYLTIADLEAVELREGSVAYLSACSTAEQTDGKLAGEAIHLANSFQALGFQHVIGTMWGANDAAAGEVAKRFYGKLGFLAGSTSVEGKGRLDIATALHEAVKEYSLTCEGSDGVLKWGPFIHVGI